MAAPFVLLLPLLAIAMITVALLFGLTRPAPATVPDAAPEPAGTVAPAVRARRHMDRFTLVAWAAMFGVGVLVVATGLQVSRLAGPLLSATPFLLGATFLVVHVVGERTWPRPEGTVRRASLARRGMREVVGRGPVLWTVVLAGLLIALVVFAGVTADGTDGALSWTSPDKVASFASAPYPGWHLGRTLLAATVLVAALTVLVLRLVLVRPAVAELTDADDLALRRASARRVLAAVQLVIGLTAAGVGLLVAHAWNGLGMSVRLSEYVTVTATTRSWESLGAAGMWLAFWLGVTCVVVAVVTLARSRTPRAAWAPR